MAPLTKETVFPGEGEDSSLAFRRYAPLLRDA